MKYDDGLKKQYDILCRLSRLPKKILALHGADNTTEFVLHELCGYCCFNLPKAAFFVDNPDFNCCKGIAGYCKTECLDHPDKAWNDPEPFSCYMQNANFNQKVRKIEHESLIQKKNIEQSVQSIGSSLEITDPLHYMWSLKNGNYGILIFEQGENAYEAVQEHFDHGFSMLGFCPIF